MLSAGSAPGIDDRSRFAASLRGGLPRGVPVIGVLAILAGLAFDRAWGQDREGSRRSPARPAASLTVPEPAAPAADAASHLEGARAVLEPEPAVGPRGSGPAQEAWLNEDESVLGPSRFFRLPEERFRGRGQPLIQESWQFRPFSIGGFFGFVQGSQLIRDWTFEEQGMIGGMTLGWDVDHYFGCEMRLAFGRVVIGDSTRAIAAQIAADDAAGLASTDPARRRFDNGRDNDLLLWEASVMYYPWGDSRWRPYATIGVGVTSVDFIDRLSTVYQDAFFTLPFGLGVKYLHNDFLAVRLECLDNMAFGGGKPIETMHHLSLIAGIEFRFGGPRRAYWPWNPGRHYW